MRRFGSILILAALGFVSWKFWVYKKDAATPGISGIDPRLSYANSEGECGTGAVVPWAGKLWVITYGPHLPFGSSDKLWEIGPDLSIRAHPESVGGTPANRMIHAESNQLLIGPYVINAQGNVRVIPPARMPGRLTGTARHLTDPANKVYYATMEEGLYEVDVHTLEVRTLIKDDNQRARPKGSPDEPAQAKKNPPPGPEGHSRLPGYHGKGLYSGQGRLVYSNNGEMDARVQTDPTIPSGALAEWKGEGDWSLIRRNQFTEVSGPGGITGSARPETDPIWSVGWDAKSLILMVLDKGNWQAFRLPKPSHSYDGSHGWNTEWPRIRDIGESDLLMTMHGAFWRFPRDFRPSQSAGIAPRSAYLKVIGDFCRWNDLIVLGCDDSAKSEFLNKRSLKTEGAAPPQSHSNLWFLQPKQLDGLGPVIARGAVWLNETLSVDTKSDPFLFSGFAHRGLYLAQQSDEAVNFTVWVDAEGNDKWTVLREISVQARESIWVDFTAVEKGAWVRLSINKPARGVVASFHYRTEDRRSNLADTDFDCLASASTQQQRGGVLRSLSAERIGLVVNNQLYTIDQSLKVSATKDDGALKNITACAPSPMPSIQTDAASIVIEEDGKRWRLPFGTAQRNVATGRFCREVATERDLLNVGGTFFELPARNAQGMAKVRAVSTHGRKIEDFCTQFGMLFITGIDADAQPNKHLLRSADGSAAVWVGAVDDLWRLGKARGQGGPWKNTAVRSGVYSDPYLMSGYDQCAVTLEGDTAATVRLEVDVDGSGVWLPYTSFKVSPGNAVHHTFPKAFGAYWIRAVADHDMTATVQLEYR
jgi:hypothetical protein